MKLKKEWRFLSKTIVDGGNYRQKLIPLLLKNRNISPRKRNEFISPPKPEEINILKLGVSKTELTKSYLRVEKAIKNKEQIVVYGDYDVDGFCSTAIVWEVLYGLGAVVLPIVPDRLNDGYGLRPEKVVWLKKKLPDLKLIITVDNGVSSFEAIKKAKKLKIDVVVIDHHLMPKGKKPTPFALVHSSNVSAGGLAWFWANHWAGADLGLAALSTVSDLMPLSGANRSLVKYGLPVLEKTRRAGLRHLFFQAGIAGKPIDVYQVAFMIAPRLNALGRLANPMDGLRLICTKRIDKGADLARLANKINSQRQQLVAKKTAEAVGKIGANPSAVIVVSDSRYHPGIVGLIASRLKETYHRPALAISKTGSVCRGSARSIEGVNIVDFLKKTDLLLESVGGHSLAAGFSLKSKNLSAWKRKVSALGRKIDKKLFRPVINIDCQVSLSALNFDFYNLMAKLSPFGQINPNPVFAVYGARIIKAGAVGKDKNHLKLAIDSQKTKNIFEAIGFGLGGWKDKLLPGDSVDLVFSLMVNSYNGKQSLVLRIDDLKAAGPMLK